VGHPNAVILGRFSVSRHHHPGDEERAIGSQKGAMALMAFSPAASNAYHGGAFEPAVGHNSFQTDFL
jgi:hypothetical protein